jgi:hypothetical protein
MSDFNDELSPTEQREVDFYGDEIPAVVVEGGQIFVPLRPICDFLGVDWSAQTRRIRRDTVLSESTSTVAVTATDGKEREMLCLQLDYLNGWLFGINANRVKVEVKEKLILYQRDCYRVLNEHFQESREPATKGMASLAHVRDMALAIANLAQEQMDFEQDVDRRFVTVEQRLTAVEERVAPGEAVTADQASQLSQAVKAVAVVLTKQSGSNQFGGVYGELYRKFGITSYKLLPAARFQEAMDFLTDWHQTLVGDEPF